MTLLAWWWIMSAMAIYALGCLISLFFVVLDWKFVKQVALESGLLPFHFVQQIIFLWPYNMLLSKRS